MPWVCDVRDIARAHICAAEIPAAKGRHIVSQGSTVPTKRLVDALSKAFPDLKFPSVKDEASQDVIDNTKVGAMRTHLERHHNLSAALYRGRAQSTGLGVQLSMGRLGDLQWDRACSALAPKHIKLDYISQWQVM